MTVEELRALLKDYDASAIVAIRLGISPNYTEVTSIAVMTMEPHGESELRTSDSEEAADCVVLS